MSLPWLGAALPFSLILGHRSGIPALLPELQQGLSTLWEAGLEATFGPM